MIYCCGAYHTPNRVIIPADTFNYTNRKLEILICPNCNSLVAELTQFSLLKQEFERIRPKRKKTFQFINSIENGEWSEEEFIKYGTKSNAAFIYGVNEEDRKGNIKQFAVDFNGVKKLVKVIQGGCHAS